MCDDQWAVEQRKITLEKISMKGLSWSCTVLWPRLSHVATSTHLLSEDGEFAPNLGGRWLFDANGARGGETFDARDAHFGGKHSFISLSFLRFSQHRSHSKRSGPESRHIRTWRIESNKTEETFGATWTLTTRVAAQRKRGPGFDPRSGFFTTPSLGFWLGQGSFFRPITHRIYPVTPHTDRGSVFT